jgi:hypothetical protein
MRLLIFVVAITAVSLPALSQAQSNPPLTHAQVLDQLVALEKAGYHPQDKTEYPTDLQRAESGAAHPNPPAGEGATNIDGTAAAGK